MRAVAVGTITIHQTKRGPIRKERTETGWKYLNAVEPRPNPNTYPVGATRTVGRRTYKKTEVGWQLVSIREAERRGPKNKSPRAAKATKSKDMSKASVPSSKVRNKASQAPKRAPVPSTPSARRPRVNDRNPDEIIVRREQGGQWVRIDSKTLVYRKQKAA